MPEPLFTLPPYAEAVAYLREHFDEIRPGLPWYHAPCAIGCLMPEDVRRALDGAISGLIRRGVIGLTNPDDALAYSALQGINDTATVTQFRAAIFGGA